MNPIQKAKAHPGSLRHAINGHCYMCMGGDPDGLTTSNSVSRDIRECQSEVCPLRSVRPFQTPLKGEQ